MKIITLAILSIAFTTSHALSATTTTETSIDVLSNKFASTVAQHKPKFRMLQVGAVESDPCWIATDALYETTTLSTAYDAWETELDNFEPDDSACTAPSQNRLECDVTLDSTTLASHDDLVDACEQVGGQTYLQSDSISCNVVDSGQEIVFDIRFLSLPHCFASTCDIEKVANDLDGYIDEAVVQYEAGFSFLFESVECTSPDSSAHG